MSYTIWADDRQLILDALNRQHDDLRRQAAGRSLAGERHASLRRYHRERADRSAQLATELAQLPYGDYVLVSRRTRADVHADAERGHAARRPAAGRCTTAGRRRGSDRGGVAGLALRETYLAARQRAGREAGQ